MTPKECSIAGHPDATKSEKFMTGNRGYWLAIESELPVDSPYSKGSQSGIVTAYCPLCSVILVETFD